MQARAALASGDAAGAVGLLTGLDASLPLVARDVVRWRAEAALEAGPYAEAATYFARSVKPKDLAKAASAYEKAGDSASAKRAADKAVAAAQKAKSRKDEVLARKVRSRILLASSSAQSKALGAADLRWIATHPTGGSRRRVLAALTRPTSFG